jgi:hypothetical protein
MLYWICPECGHECSPAIRECPTCTAPPAVQKPPAIQHAPAVQQPIQQPAPQRTSISWELLSLAENFQSRPSVAVLTDVALLTAPPVEPKQSQKLAQLDNLAVRPARPARSEPVNVSPVPFPAGLFAENFQSRPSLAWPTGSPVEPKLSQKLVPLDNLAVRPARPARSEPVIASPAPFPISRFAQNFQSRPSLAWPTAAPVEPKLSQKLAPLDNLAVRPARPARSEPVTLSVASVPFRLSSPAVLPVVSPTRAEFCLVLAGSAPVGGISFQAARPGKSSVIEQPAEPLPSRRRSIAFVRAELRGADRGQTATADLAQRVAQPEYARLKTVVPDRTDQLNDVFSTPLGYKPLPYKPTEPALVCSRLKLTGDSLTELLNALNASAEERDRAAIQAIQASFCEKPAVGLLPAPKEIVTAPAPPTAQWLRSEKPRFTAAAPQNTGRAGVVVGWRPPTLAGPSLPPQLLNLDLRNSSLRRRKRSSWPISLLVAIIVILGAVALFQNATQDRAAMADSSAAPVQTTKAAPAPLRVVQEHPAARSVEVAGIRLVTGPNRKPQLEYIVINHSSSELTGLNIRIAVRSVEALEDAPLFSVSNVVASLGPNQSKEVRAEVDSSIQPSSIPDWQSLRTEVLVARQ